MKSAQPRIHFRAFPLFAAALVLVLVPAMLIAQPMMGRPLGPEDAPGFMAARALQHLDLTDTQKDQLKGLVESHRDTMRDRMKAMFEARESLNKAIHAEPYNEQAVRTAAQKVGQLETDMALSRAQMRQQLKSILTPEQFGQLEGFGMAMRSRAREQMRDRGPRCDCGRGFGPGRQQGRGPGFGWTPPRP